MRMIEQFTQVLNKIIFKKENKQFDEAKIEIQQAFISFIELDYELISAISSGELLSLINLNGRLDYDKCRMVAELLKQDAEICEMEGKDIDSYNSYLKSVCLFLELILQQVDTHMMDVAENVDIIIEKLAQYELPGDVQFKLMKYREFKAE
jgi:hypothetical protein